jgi:GGDEF domain-containing protein
MALDAPRLRRARPVADAPVDALLARSDAIAKGWALALIEQAPLSAAPGILTEPLTRDGPRVCDAAVRALADDDDLRRLGPGGALRPLAMSIGAMTGSAGPGEAVRTVDALSGVLWSALRDELRTPDPDLVTDLAERLALVCSVIRGAVLAGPADGEPEAVEPATTAEKSGPEEPTRRSVDPPPAAAAPHAAAPLWLSALRDEVRDSDSGGWPLSLLLAELEDADRVIASATPERAGMAFSDFVAALRRVLRRQDILVCEDDARAWVIARQTTRSGAHSLGVRIAESVGQSSPLSGAPLVASVGVAVLGEDGESPDELVEAAEEARFSASARGIEVSRRVPERDRD